MRSAARAEPLRVARSSETMSALCLDEIFLVDLQVPPQPPPLFPPPPLPQDKSSLLNSRLTQFGLNFKRARVCF